MTFTQRESWGGSAEIGGRKIHLETGKIARQANGSVLIRQGDTVVLVTAVAAKVPREGTDFFPLTVEFRGRLSAAGRYPGGYRKREGRISDREILSSRLIDRTIRPLFPDGYRCEVQVIANVLAYEPGGDPEVLAITGAAAALHLSDIPFSGPVAGLRVVKTSGGEILAFPDTEHVNGAALDLVASIGPGGLVMVEGLAQEVPEADVMRAIETAAEAARPLFALLEQARKAAGVEKIPFEAPAADPELVTAVEEAAGGELRRALAVPEKAARAEATEAVLESTRARLAETHPDREAELPPIFHDLEKRLLRERVLGEKRRADGRGPAEIRPISSEVGLIPRVHGSALFTRGETQALVVSTLGSARDEQEVETLAGVEKERFQLHYSFPPYSVGETRPLRGPGRREIGHGNLAHRAIEAILPPAETFPYTIKVESEITESNGSSSMATVCGGCLALMDAGVPIVRPVAGIAMGLIAGGDHAVVLSDILGVEDHLGDMDFKVAGTEVGVTAVQLDNKLGTLPGEWLRQALEQAREGRLHILRKMSRALAAPRGELSPHAPRIESVRIGTHRIGDLIGPGGKHIKEVQAATGAAIDVSDDGLVRIFAGDASALSEARARVRDLTGEPEIGRVYRGLVTGVKDFGCFVRLFQGIEGLVHVSELAEGRVEAPSQVCSEGEEMVVRVLGVERGKIKLSRKAALGADPAEIANG